MTRLILALLAVAFAAVPAQATQIRYDFAGTLAIDTITGPSGDALVAGAGLPGGFSGFVIFDTDAPKEGDADFEIYAASSFGLTVGSYTLPAGVDRAFAVVQPFASGLTFGFQTTGDFDAGIDGASLSLFFDFNEMIVPGIVQNPTGNATGDLFITTDDSTVIATGAITEFGVTAVPEPASWAMMIAGFGLLGGALRRRRGASINGSGVPVIPAATATA